MTFGIPQIILAVAILTSYASLHSQPRWDAFYVLTELSSAGHQLSAGQATSRFGVISRCPRDLPSLEEWLRL
jgi:hypothetical protein